ncbi:GTP-binding protein REM 1-like [Littorina saxatilis]|uniref:GTP-binding protein REM 1-like n=1 Tax=Littorina saxatilis TaxID=31220 RepID=UPI0038B47E45
MATMTMDILVEGERITDPDEKFLRVSPLRDSASAPHSRSSSFKNRPRPKLSLDIAAAQRPRTNSLPTSQLFLSLPNPDWMPPPEPEKAGLCRVRSFKTTSKGIVNHGDSFKRSTHSLVSNGSFGSIDHLGQVHPGGGSSTKVSSSKKARSRSIHSEDSAAAPAPPKAAEVRVTPASAYYKVLMMGSTGSGKSALTRQFMTSEYKGTYEITTPDVEEDAMSVSVLLDGEESTLEFIDEELHPDVEGEDITIDAYVVVFSVTDPGSYNYAVNTVRKLRVESGIDRAIILVGNKIDLVRQRRVTKHEATKLAHKYDCRYTETSAALNHHVDELLVGILSQIRLKLKRKDDNLLKPSKDRRSRSRSKSPSRAMSFFQRLFGHGTGKSKGNKTPETLFVK